MKTAEHFSERPCAAPGYKSYRYRGRYGWIMIGARNDTDAMHEAARSIGGPADVSQLMYWDGTGYAPILPWSPARESKTGSR